MRRLVIVATLAIALTGCAESSAEVNTPSAMDSKAANPRFAEAAQRALAEAPAPEPGWRIGVVLTEQAEDTWAAGVLTATGEVYLTYSWSDECDDGRYGDEEFPLLVDPGDLITWAGDGRTVHRVCAEDLRVIRKAVA